MDYNFKHFLVIDGEEIEILEPINFDASSFIVEQDKKKWGRDIYKGNEEISLYFGNEIGEPLEIERVLNNGMILRHKNSGLDLLLQINKELGSEAVVYWKLEFGTDFLLFELDFGTAKTDNLTYIELKVIQNTDQAKIKRREKIKVDAFATKDLDNNTIAPITTHKMLLKAKPIVQVSEWLNIKNNPFVMQGGYFEPDFVNPMMQITKYGIDNTLSWFQFYASGNSSSNEVRDIGKCVYISENELSNVKVKVNLNLRMKYIKNTDSGEQPISVRLCIFKSQNTQSEWLSKVNDPSNGYFEQVMTNGYDQTFNQEITTEISNVSAGEYIYVFFQYFTSPSGDAFIENYFYDSSFEITATSTAISSVINAVRYIDLIKQNYKGIGATPVIAPKFDVGGQFYNNFCFNGKMIRQLQDPFYLELNDTLESLEEFCADSQINDGNNYIGQYTDFYPNIDLGGFLINPDKDFSIEKNERYLINKFTFGYKKYQKDNDESNTLDAIHTDSERYVPNNKSQNEKKVSLPFARDHYLAEDLRRRATNNTSADIDDDTIFIFDVIELAPNSRESFTSVLKFQQSDEDDTFKLLANENFSWNLLGFNVGNTINVNGVDYLVNEITPTLLSLQWLGGDAQGEEVFTIDYPLTGVQYTIRTSEGLTFSENLLNADVYGNLRYSIKHNVEYWKPYLATAGKFIPTKEITNSYFKANGACRTKFTDDSEIIGENEPILISDISGQKILSQNIIKTTVTASFDRVKQLLEGLQTINIDNTIGGFVRVQDQNGRVLKGYVQKLDNLWKYEELTFELEERNESDFLDIIFSGGIFTINEVGYSPKTFTEKRYNIFNDFIQFFDENNVFLCNRTKYNQIRLNGIVYDNVDDLVIAIDLLS